MCGLNSSLAPTLLLRKVRLGASLFFHFLEIKPRGGRAALRAARGQFKGSSYSHSLIQFISLPSLPDPRTTLPSPPGAGIQINTSPLSWTQRAAKILAVPSTLPASLLLPPYLSRTQLSAQPSPAPLLLPAAFEV